jgi:hypothetical protein
MSSHYYEQACRDGLLGMDRYDNGARVAAPVSLAES